MSLCWDVLLFPEVRRVQEYAGNKTKLSLCRGVWGGECGDIHPVITLVSTLPEDITLDSSTAHPRLFISPDGKQVRCSDRHQLVADNPERFDRVVCVLAHQGFSSGRHYWEVGETLREDGDVSSQCPRRRGRGFIMSMIVEAHKKRRSPRRHVLYRVNVSVCRSFSLIHSFI